MKEEYYEVISALLSDIPEGGFELRGESGIDFSADTAGKGMVEVFSVIEGVSASLHRYIGESVVIRHTAIPNILEITHCRRGRIGWKMTDGSSVYMGAGDICLHAMDSCHRSEMTLPLGFYEGITFSFDMTAEISSSLTSAGISVGEIFRRLCTEGKPAVIPVNPELDSIFSPLYSVSDRRSGAYRAVKAQELLLYLDGVSAECRADMYISRQSELIREIRDFLVENVDKRYTIEELSRRYLINTSSLKSIFKAVYGLPIATYMKEYRVRRAAELLRTTDYSIAEISEMVGYETQGKFSKAFREITDTLPTEYRKQHK